MTISKQEFSAKLVKAELDARLFNNQTPLIEQKNQIFHLKNRLYNATVKKLPKNIIFGIATKLHNAERQYNYQLENKQYWDSYNSFCSYWLNDKL